MYYPKFNYKDFELLNTWYSDLDMVIGNSLDVLKTLPDESVHWAITSPPYYGLRVYRVPDSVWGGDDKCKHEWDEVYMPVKGGKERKSSFCSKCGAWKGCLGLEPSVGLYLDHLVMIFEEVRRVLRSEGVFWLDIGDSYFGSPGQYKSDKKDGAQIHSTPSNLKSKDLIGVPWALAFALRDAGWYLRQDNIWAKGVSSQKDLVRRVREIVVSEGGSVALADRVVSVLEPYDGNPMVSSARDRTSTSHEHIFRFSKNERYYSDYYNALESYEKPLERWGGVVLTIPPVSGDRDEAQGNNGYRNRSLRPNKGRNRRSVWAFPTASYKGSHFAVFPPELVRLCALFNTYDRGVCSKCGAPFVRIINKKNQSTIGHLPSCKCYPNIERASNLTGVFVYEDDVSFYEGEVKKADGISTSLPIVLDMFGGSGTTAGVMLGRKHRCILIDSSEDYVSELVEKRVGDVMDTTLVSRV